MSFAAAVQPAGAGGSSQANGTGSVISLNKAGGAGPEGSRVEKLLQSEVGVNALLMRLRQSIVSCRDFAGFLKKRASIQEDHANGLKKLCKLTNESLVRPDGRQGTYFDSFQKATNIHDRLADNGITFATALFQMQEDLLELVNNMERGRKDWKHSCQLLERRIPDAVQQMEKCKSRYDSLAEEYERTRNGQGRSNLPFGLGVARSGAHHEEEVKRKLEAADSEYQRLVQQANAVQKEVFQTARPQAVTALKALIAECDAGLTLTLQRFASLNEKLVLNDGLCITPLKTTQPGDSTGPGLADVVLAIDNDADLQRSVIDHSQRVAPAVLAPIEYKYEKHAALMYSQQPPQQQQQQPAAGGQAPQQFQPQPGPQYPTAGPQAQPSRQELQSYQTQPPPQQAQQIQNASGPQGGQVQGLQGQGPQGQGPQGFRSPSQTISPGGPQQQQQQGFNQSPQAQGIPPQQQQIPPPQQYQPQYQQQQQQQQQPQQQQQQPQQQQPSSPTQFPLGQQTHQQAYVQQQQQQQPPRRQSPVQEAGNLPRLRPLFGVPLDALLVRDGHAVPTVVSQCMQAVDLFGLNTEGIYRHPGANSHVQKIKNIFDNDPSQVDFRNPEDFFQDVNSVASALKQFFRELPDPLLTHELYDEFIKAAQINDKEQRRDSMHELVNKLPDANYATIRALILHLNRVMQNSEVNKMTSWNLAICFGPTLLGSNTNKQMSNMQWHNVVVDTILQNTFEIFEDD